jgi:hypothetical protein
MNNKSSHAPCRPANELDLAAAVEHFVAQGGVIEVIPEGESVAYATGSTIDDPPGEDPDQESISKLEHLKELVAKGAGICALQYSLRMNKKDIKQLASTHGVKIAVSRPALAIKRAARHDPLDVDDRVAGHVMHYSSLGYTVHEIANLLDLSVRQVWNIGKAYRFEFQQKREDETS